MKDVWYDVSQFDTDVTIALSILELRLQIIKNHKSNAN